MDPYGSLTGVSRLSDHTIYYPKQETPSTPGSAYSRGSATMYANSPSMSVYAPPAHAQSNGTYPPQQYYRSPSGYPSGTYMEEDLYPSYQQRSSLGSAAGDVLDFSSTGSRYGSRQYERTTDYWLSVADSAAFEYNRTRSSPQTVYSSGPVRFQSPLDGSSPRFRPRFGQSPRGRGLSGFKPRRGGLTTPSGDGEDVTIRRAPPPSLYCEVCKVGCAGPKALADHQNGQRHKKRVAQSEAIERLKQTSGGETLKTTTNTYELRCELCDVVCTGAEAYSAHISGRLHQRAVRLHRDLGKPVPNTDNPLVPSAVAKAIEVKPEQGQSRGQPTTPATSTTTEAKVGEESGMKHVELSKLMSDEKKPVGAEFIQVIPGPGGKGIHYQCTLCECQFTNADAKELHLKGRRHRLQYKKKVDPALVVERKPSNSFYKRQSGNRPVEKASVIPPMPSSSSLSWPGILPTNDVAPFFNGQQLFPRMNYRNQGPGAFASPPAQHPNVTLENRYLGVKHANIVPTELEAQAMKTAVGLCEFSLKRISDDLFESSKREAATESARVDKKQDTPAKTDDQPSQSNGAAPTTSATPTEPPVEENRLLRGVVRVGSLGKSLLLRGDNEGDLVLVCSEWPTSEVVNFVKTELIKKLTTMDDRYEYDLSAIPAQGQITIRVTRKVPESELKADISIADEWPVITIRIQLTSSAACDKPTDGKDSDSSVESGAVKAAAADGSNVTANTALTTAPEQPQASNTPKPESLSRARQLFAQGERIPKNVCLDALDAIDQAKWFQGALLTPPLGIVARVLVDFMRANKVWQKLNQFGVLALLSRLLNLDLQLTCPASARAQRSPFMPPVQPRPLMSPQPLFGTPVRSRMPLPPMPLIGPGRLFRRFFEAIAAGLLIQLRVEEAQQVEPTIPTAGKIEGDEATSARFFAYNLLAATPMMVREEITVSAQFCLRQIAFKQLYKVLRMEPLTHTGKKETAKDSSEAAVVDAETTESVDLEAAAPGAVKRRRSELDTTDIQDQEEAEVEEVDEGKETKQQQPNAVPTPDKSASADKPAVVEAVSTVTAPKVVPSPATRAGTAAKRSRRGR